MTDPTTLPQDVLIVRFAEADTQPAGGTAELAAAFAERGWTQRIVTIVEGRGPEGAATDAGTVVVQARVDRPDLRAWPPQRVADPSGWRETVGPDDAGLWEPQWTDQVRTAIADHVAQQPPDLLYVATAVWSIADAVRSVAAEHGIPFVVEPQCVRPPGLRRGLGSVLGPVTEVEREVVAAASAVLVPTDAIEEWAVQHPQARVLALGLSASEAPAALAPTEAASPGVVTVLGGVPGSAPLGELVDAWQLARTGDDELLWWGAEPLDRSQRSLLDEAAPLGVRRTGGNDDQALAAAPLVVALLGDRQGLPRGATTALAAGTPVLLVARPDHAALAAAAQPGVVAVPAQADLIARVLATPPSRHRPDHAAVAAVVAGAWGDAVGALLAEAMA